MQDNYFFREPSTQKRLLDILFIYAKLNPDIGYRQGMHELLAPILWAIHQDAVDLTGVPAVDKKAEGTNFMIEVLDGKSSNMTRSASSAPSCKRPRPFTKLARTETRHRLLPGAKESTTKCSVPWIQIWLFIYMLLASFHRFTRCKWFNPTVALTDRVQPLDSASIRTGV